MVVVLNELINLALREDAPWGDVTTSLTVPEGTWMRADVVTRQPAILSGTQVIGAVYERCGSGSVKVQLGADDGELLDAGTVIATLEGPADEMLLGERVCLNILQHLCAVATTTAAYVQEVEGTGARIIDTRKTTPGMRELERAAVRHGGGHNHRFSLSDAVLVKDNHIAAIGGLEQLAGLRETMGHLTGLEVEIDSLDQLEAALATGADSILCDNFSLDDLRAAVDAIGDAAFVNASGGVRLDTVRAIADTGVDLISVGAITHSTGAVDIGLDATLS